MPAQPVQPVQAAQPQASRHVNGLQAYSDLNATPCGDPAIEALVGQLQLSMKNMVDLARSGYAQERSRAAVARGADAEALLVASGGG